MRGKRFFFVMVIAAVLVIGWLFALKSASGIDEINQQNELVSQADEYLEKKLYVRGIPLLEQALTIKTKNSDVVQRKLLEAYWGYGEVDDYYALLQEMDADDSNKKADVEDYLRLTDYYQEQRKTEDALKVVIAGQKKHPDAELDALYEKLRYGYAVDISEYQQLRDTKDGGMHPAFDGKVWNYADEGGREYLIVNAQEAVAFNEKYGVVKVDDRYHTILSNGDLYGIDETGVDEVLGLTDRFIIAKKDGMYGYYNYDFQCMSDTLQFEDITINNDGVAAVKKDGKWGIINDSGETVTDFIYEDVAVNSLGYAFAGGHAMVKKDGAWMLIDTTGAVLSGQTFADAKAPESDEYIAVANAEGKWGFIDSEGNLVIDYQYYDAASFSCEMAPVMVVNSWGYISRKNNLVIDDYFESAQPFHNGYAVAHTAAGVNIIEQMYYDMEE